MGILSRLRPAPTGMDPLVSKTDHAGLMLGVISVSTKHVPLSGEAKVAKSC
jgi:hypothetical protein